MFGLVISGRPLDAQPTQISQTQYAFRIPSSPPFSHLTTFLLPATTLPPDVGATVWIQLPGSTEFKFLGALAMTKPSAIFKISGVGNLGARGGVVGSGGDDDMLDDMAAPGAATSGGPAEPSGEIVLGISIEPAAAVEQQLLTLKSTSTSSSSTTTSGSALVRQPPASSSATGASPVTTKVLAQRIIGNAFNFLASFGSDTVPLKAFQDWWSKFEKKIDLDPTFLERAEAQE